MLKFIKHNLSSISGVEIYPVISLSIFFLFFVAVGVLAAKMSKKSIDELSQMPLND